MKIRPQFRTCFISAPFGANTSILRKALEERGIRWRDQTSIKPGSSLIEVLDKEISRSDFVCIVLPAERQENILFEMGVAYAKRKPILAFINFPLQIPSDILSLTYVRSDPTNPEAVRLALSAFLEHAKPTPPRRLRTSSAKVIPEKGPVLSAAASTRGFKFERQTAELFQQAGFIVSEPGKLRDKGVDFAVWIDELDHSLGNPILVEVKAGDISANRLREAASQLRHYVSRTHGRCALLVYWDRSNREFPQALFEWPLVYQLSGTTLLTLVSQGTLVQELVRLRNEAVHGKG